MKILFSICLMLLMTGCSWFTKIEYVPYKEYVLIDDYDLRDCPVPQPPDKEAYMKGSKDQRIAMWMETYYDTVEMLTIRNLHMKHTREQNELHK